MDPENAAAAPEVDLFGNEMLPLRDRRGRKSFKKDKENQDFVAARAADGWTQEMIADELGCDPKTLRKNFSRELKNGHMIVRGLCLDVLMRRVREGHAPSVRQMLERLDRVAPPAPRGKGREVEADAEDEAPKSEVLGKKEQRLRDAGTPESDYGSLYDRIPRQ